MEKDAQRKRGRIFYSKTRELTEEVNIMLAEAAKATEEMWRKIKKRVDGQVLLVDGRRRRRGRWHRRQL